MLKRLGTLLVLLAATATTAAIAEPVRIEPGQRWVILPKDSTEPINLVDSLKTDKSVDLMYFTPKPHVRFCVVYTGKDVDFGKGGPKEQCVESDDRGVSKVSIPVKGDGVLIVGAVTRNEEVDTQVFNLFRMERARKAKP